MSRRRSESLLPFGAVKLTAENAENAEKDKTEMKKGRRKQ